MATNHDGHKPWYMMMATTTKTSEINGVLLRNCKIYREFTVIQVCGHHGRCLWPSWFVAVMVCGRHCRTWPEDKQQRCSRRDCHKPVSRADNWKWMLVMILKSFWSLLSNLKESWYMLRVCCTTDFKVVVCDIVDLKYAQCGSAVSRTIDWYWLCGYVCARLGGFYHAGYVYSLPGVLFHIPPAHDSPPRAADSFSRCGRLRAGKTVVTQRHSLGLWLLYTGLLLVLESPWIFFPNFQGLESPWNRHGPWKSLNLIF